MTTHHVAPAEILRKPYQRVLIPNEEGPFTAKILEFPGCIAEGPTPGEAYEKLERVAESWLLSLIERKIPIPEPYEEREYSGRTLVRLGSMLHEDAALAAEREGVSLNSFIVTAVARSIGAKTADGRLEEVLMRLKAIERSLASTGNAVTLTTMRSSEYIGPSYVASTDKSRAIFAATPGLSYFKAYPTPELFMSQADSRLEEGSHA